MCLGSNVCGIVYICVGGSVCLGAVCVCAFVCDCVNAALIDMILVLSLSSPTRVFCE